MWYLCAHPPKVSFVTAIFDGFSFQCAVQYGLDVNDITKCYNTNEGTIHQLKAEQDTIRILPKFIPTILYNGVRILCKYLKIISNIDNYFFTINLVGNRKDTLF